GHADGTRRLTGIVLRRSISKRVTIADIAGDLPANRHNARQFAQLKVFASAYLRQLFQDIRITIRIALVEDSDGVNGGAGLLYAAHGFTPLQLTGIVASVAHHDQRLFVHAALDRVLK